MKKALFTLIIVPAVLFTVEKTYAQQQVKVGIFDIEYMVRAMPGYASVDSLLQIYQRDSLGAQYDSLLDRYKALDSTYKADSIPAAANASRKVIWDSVGKQRQQTALYLMNWQQIAQYNVEGRRQQLAQPLYQKVGAAYQKVLTTRKYNLIFKPEAVEVGTLVADNLFVAVGRELKLTSLPQELLQFGNDPDAGKTTAAPPQKTNPPANKKP